jgi:hypothetical protein
MALTPARVIAQPAVADPSDQIAIPANPNAPTQTTTAASTQAVVAGAVYINSAEPQLLLTDTDNQQVVVIRSLGGTLLISSVVRSGIDTPGMELRANSYGDLVSVDQSGNVAVGARNGAHRLRVAGGPRWTARNWGGAMELDDGAAIAWGPGTRDMPRFGMGAWDGNFYLFRTLSNPGQTNHGPANDLRINSEGVVAVNTLEILGADLAENFPVSTVPSRDEHDAEAARAGHVVIIDSESPGQLAVSHAAYDRRVAGVISGANGLGPGVVLGREDAARDPERHPVALNGRVYCWADASVAAIEPGDLLTTSTTRGHAMKVVDHQRAQGAILGKAMSSLRDGTGLVLVLVTLQ